ncbi:hypothetical protein GGX14DRAFT_387704 [Mycena pura]|uniref:Uncharacterized protein n=1 Tax=Mycena pura TaxID=153505 RepID=A0AAD7E196_9AGAR|nr:hypothetical protein GGX14DRAFT_387704 [Mycena pura]
MYHADKLPPYTPAGEKEDTRGQVAWRSLSQLASSRIALACRWRRSRFQKRYFQIFTRSAIGLLALIRFYVRFVEKREAIPIRNPKSISGETPFPCNRPGTPFGQTSATLVGR